MKRFSHVIKVGKISDIFLGRGHFESIIKYPILTHLHKYHIVYVHNSVLLCTIRIWKLKHRQLKLTWHIQLPLLLTEEQPRVMWTHLYSAHYTQIDIPNIEVFRWDYAVVFVRYLRDGPSIHQYCADRLVEWCEKNWWQKKSFLVFQWILTLNLLLSTHNTQTNKLPPFKYLSIYVEAALSWSTYWLYL